MFLGVSETSKAYELFNPVTKKVIISRDVVFDEEAKWDWTDRNFVPKATLDDDVSDGNTEEVPESQEQQLSQSQLVPLPKQQLDEARHYNLRDENTRKRPAWMMDYDLVDSSSDEDINAHFALYVDSDPMTYDEAIKEKIWKEAMDKKLSPLRKIMHGS